MTESKTCVICADTFTRAEGMTPNNWALQKYCSHQCRVRATTRKKGMRRDVPHLTPEQEAAKVEYDRRALETWRDKHEATVRKVNRQRARVMESAG